MSGSIREIVVYSDQALMASEDQIWWALRVACAEKFVKELDQGIDSLLGERGLSLSEGQMQRLAIRKSYFPRGK